MYKYYPDLYFCFFYGFPSPIPLLVPLSFWGKEVKIEDLRANIAYLMMSLYPHEPEDIFTNYISTSMYYKYICRYTKLQ